MNGEVQLIVKVAGTAPSGIVTATESGVINDSVNPQQVFSYPNDMSAYVGGYVQIQSLTFGDLGTYYISGVDINNPAFEYLRQFKKVSDESEELVMKVVKKRYPEISLNELVNIFEQGITGDFGKVYSADPETLLDWVRSYTNRKGNQRSYYETPILTPDVTIYDQRYPEKQEDWNKEVNKGYTAYLNGVSTKEMHPHIYDRLMVDAASIAAKWSIMLLTSMSEPSPSGKSSPA